MTSPFHHRGASRPAAGGYVVILNTLIFLVISVFIIYAIATPLIASNRTAAQLEESKQAYIAANSAVEEVLYKLKNQMQVDSSEMLTLASTTAEVTVADTFDGKDITVDAAAVDVERNIHLAISESEGVNFNYGLQAGQGGFQMSGGAGINGNVYSNGDISGSGGPYITGSATVANSSDPVADQSNGSGAPSNDVIFGGQLVWDDPKPEDAAQSFRVSTTTPVSSVRLYIKKYANVWMNNATLRITNDTSGHPGKTTLASGSVSATQVTTSYNYLSIPFSSTPTLTPGTTYWLVLDTSNTWGSYYVIGADQNGYAGGAAKTGSWSSSNGGTWSDTAPSGLDLFFDLYVGGDTGSISGVTIGSAGGDAWAHEVDNSTVQGSIYCQASASNNKPCDTSRPDPVQQPYPISDGNIEAWKDEALAGGTHTGNVSYGSADTATIGPEKIDGNLTVGGGATLYVSGTLWVTGNVTVNGGGRIRLANSYGSSSGVIVTDGRVTAGGGGQFEGNGSAGSYILVVTTSACPSGSCSGHSAVEVSGGTGAVVLNAQHGTIEFTGGAQAKQATAETIVMSGGTTISYESGLSDINFSSGPSGGWSIDEWDEI
jgi:hypothetical protein